MSESVDLRRILKCWPYDPEHDARIVPGDDGVEVLQVRTPAGIEQYELDGRPDGVRPHGKDSALDYYLERLEGAKAAGGAAEFELGIAACSELFNEGTLFYFRYVKLFQLQDWPRTIRDTARNLRVFDLVHRYAQREEDQQFLEKWRPYVLRVHASASAMLAVEKHAYDQALRVTHAAISQIEALSDLDDDTFRFERERSIDGLRDLEAQIEKKRPLSPLEQLERELRQAIEKQEFERAALLRDRIRALRQQYTC